MLPRNLVSTLLLSILVLHFSVQAHSSSVQANSSSDQGNSNGDDTPLDSSIEWALNVGGDSYLGADGISYQADTRGNTEPLIDSIRGTQDGTVFKSYRQGSNELDYRLDNGYYDLIFKFSEPQKIDLGKRVFDVVVQGETVIPALDVTQARDGNAKSALVRMVPKVLVDDGTLNIKLQSLVGQPILSALVVRKRMPDPENWVLTWGDEFNYTGQPDASKWTHDIWPARKVNDEQQSYTDRLRNVRVEEGVLTIEAHREDYNNAEYTSGRLHAAGKGDLLYGRIEVRAKLPAGQGTWPAIWMLPSNPFRYATSCSPGDDWQGSKSCDAWPNSGEIDIMEHVGYDMNRVHGTVHTKAYYWVNGEQRKSSVEADRVDQQFHLYTMDWSPKRIDIYYGDALYFTYLNQGEGWQAWPYDHPFHLILNLAVGGGWGSAGGPTDITAFPAKMQVDYVRLFKKADISSARTE
jgi:beta-glucanase (GH16 family)